MTVTIAIRHGACIVEVFQAVAWDQAALNCFEIWFFMVLSVRGSSSLWGVYYMAEKNMLGATG